MVSKVRIGLGVVGSPPVYKLCMRLRYCSFTTIRTIPHHLHPWGYYVVLSVCRCRAYHTKMLAKTLNGAAGRPVEMVQYSTYFSPVGAQQLQQGRKRLMSCASAINSTRHLCTIPSMVVVRGVVEGLSSVMAPVVDFVGGNPGWNQCGAAQGRRSELVARHENIETKMSLPGKCTAARLHTGLDLSRWQVFLLLILKFRR